MAWAEKNGQWEIIDMIKEHRLSYGRKRETCHVDVGGGSLSRQPLDENSPPSIEVSALVEIDNVPGTVAAAVVDSNSIERLNIELRGETLS